MWANLLKRRNGRARHISMEHIWESWPRDNRKEADTAHESVTPLAKLNTSARQAVRDNLLEFENRLSDDTQPLQTLRRELMDSLDRRVLNAEILKLPPELRARLRQQNSEILQSDSEAQLYLVANELRMAVLREYASLRFGDRVEGDWFDVYEKAARLRQRSTRQYIERTLGGTQSATDDARFQSITLVDKEIRARLLQVPAGTRFPGFGRTGGASV